MLDAEQELSVITLHNTGVLSFLTFLTWFLVKDEYHICVLHAWFSGNDLHGIQFGLTRLILCSDMTRLIFHSREYNKKMLLLNIRSFSVNQNSSRASNPQTGVYIRN